MNVSTIVAISNKFVNSCYSFVHYMVNNYYKMINKGTRLKNEECIHDLSTSDSDFFGGEWLHCSESLIFTESTLSLFSSAERTATVKSAEG